MNSLERLSRRLLRLEREVKHLGRTPQLAYSSVEGGPLEFNDQDGNVGVIIGPQPDGTNVPVVVGGPIPPTPVGGIVDPFYQGALLKWDGLFADDAVAPLDFARIEIHASQEGDAFIPDMIGTETTTMVGSFSSPRGGRYSVSRLAEGQWWFKLVTRTLSGKFSDPSDAYGPVTPNPTAALDYDALSIGFVLAGAIQVGDGGATNPIRISGTEGIVLPQPDGGEIRFPVDGSGAKITADLTATSLLIKDDLTVNGTGEINGELDLANGVPTPRLAPTISQEWPSILSALNFGGADVSNTYHGLETHHSDSSQMVAAVGFLNHADIRILNRVDGSLAVYPDPTYGKAWANGFSPWGGIARIGGSYYLLGTDSNRGGVYIYRISATTWDKTDEINFSTNTFFTSYQIRLVSDGSELGVVWTTPSGGDLKLRWYKANLAGRSVTAGRTTDITLISNIGGHDIGGATWGDTGTGTVRLWVALRASSTYQCMAFNTSTYARVTSEDFDRANGADLIGMMYDDVQGRMVSIDKFGYHWTYSKFTTATTLQAKYTFYDGDNSVYPAGTFISGVDVSGTPSGTHETLPSPTTTFTLKRRAWPVFETAAPPDERVLDADRVDKANRIGLYFGLSGGTLYRHGYLANASGIAVRTVRGVDTLPSSGTAPLVNGFTSAFVAPGRIRSGAIRADGEPMNFISGDGSARLDGLIPPGCMIFWHSSAAPNGWLTCNGAAISRTTYAELFSRIGTNFGVGDGSTTFNLPDARDRVLMMFGPGNAIRSTDTLQTGSGSTTFPDLALNLIIKY